MTITPLRCSTSVFCNTMAETDSERGEVLFRVLQLSCDSNENPVDIRRKFSQEVTCLHAFLNEALNDLIECEGSDDKAYYAGIAQGFAEIFIYMSTLNKEGMSFYNKFIEKRRGPVYDSESANRLFFESFFKDVPSRVELLYFRETLIEYRRVYHCRFSINEVVRYVLDRRPFFTPNKILFDVHFFYATSSLVLDFLKHTDNKVFSAKSLVAKGIIPFSFIMSEVAAREGLILGDSILSLRSVPDLYRHNEEGKNAFEFVYGIYKYMSEGNVFTIDHQRNIALVRSKIVKLCDLIEKCRFLKPQWFVDNESFPLNRFSNWLSSVFESDDDEDSFFLGDVERVMASFRSDFCSDLTFQSRLNAWMDGVQNDFDAFKKTQNYRQYMPKAMDPDGTLGYSYLNEYWFKIFTGLTLAIARFRLAVNRDVSLHAEVQEAFELSYPIVLGSSFLNASMGYPEGLLLGEDFNVLVAPKSKHDVINAVLIQAGLSDQVRLLDIEELIQQGFCHKAALPLFNDFARLSSLKITHS